MFFIWKPGILQPNTVDTLQLISMGNSRGKKELILHCLFENQVNWVEHHDEPALEASRQQHQYLVANCLRTYSCPELDWLGGVVGCVGGWHGHSIRFSWQLLARHGKSECNRKCKCVNFLRTSKGLCGRSPKSIIVVFEMIKMVTLLYKQKRDEDVVLVQCRVWERSPCHVIRESLLPIWKRGCVGYTFEKCPLSSHSSHALTLPKYVVD